jgi:hypothetical protein
MRVAAVARQRERSVMPGMGRPVPRDQRRGRHEANDPREASALDLGRPVVARPLDQLTGGVGAAREQGVAACGSQLDEHRALVTVWPAGSTNFFVATFETKR